MANVLHMPRKCRGTSTSAPTVRSGQLFAGAEPPEQPAHRQRRSATANRQEVLNVLFAQLLEERGLVAAPEQIISRLDLRTRRMPDVLVDFQGLRLAIEFRVLQVNGLPPIRAIAVRRLDGDSKFRKRSYG